ncbi:unnamed protein product [Trifolium pratense]|uniref:Uncharacterized protein n=1 Tax=Trifolium pratense TaxID=57577 RepID=A0ACB0LKI3_TRIPR|nr:unnamed protein product [Trifolium pratense]
MAMQQTISASCLKKFDVFISFHGKDTRRKFTSHLYDALSMKVRTFIDENELEKGDEISSALIKAIEEAYASLVIFSKNYASSKWCLNELVKILECKKNHGQIVIPVFYEIDPSHVRNQVGSYGQAFEKHEQDLRRNKDEIKLQKWRNALTEAANLSGWHSQNYRIESNFIKDIVEDILKKLNRKHPSEVDKKIVGIEKNNEETDLAKTESNDVRTLGLCGIKKTTLAKDLYVKLWSKFNKPKEEFASEVQEEFVSEVQEPEKNKLVFLEGCSYNFDLEDLLRAPAEVLGEVSYGSSYKATLLLEEEEAMIVLVIRLKEGVVGKKEFEQHMEILERVGQHTNVVPLRAYYFWKDERYMVYDYVPAGNLSTLLHGSRSGGRTTPFDWDSRVKVSLGTARGIAHIHSVGGTKFTHGNIMSSNVLLNQDKEGCFFDFGLTSLVNVPAKRSRVAGYRAPEVIKTGNHSHKSDVYSFGVLLLELLTGIAPQPPLQSRGRYDIIDLPRWVRSVIREQLTIELFDDELKYENMEKEMVQMLDIAMACVAKMPDMRPNMVEVVRMIEEIQ